MDKRQMNNFNNHPYREPEQSRSSMWTDWRIILVVGLVVGFLVGYVIFAGNPGEDITTIIDNNDKAIGEIGEAVASINDIIIVNDQSPADRVFIKKAMLDEDGWVVIYTDRDGKPDYIIGAQFFTAGTYEDFYTWIETSTVAGNYYHAVIHNDDGYIFETEFGRHVFDFTKDLPTTDDAGNWLGNRFRIVAIGSRG